jgi:hypothetical protein
MNETKGRRDAGGGGGGVTRGLGRESGLRKKEALLKVNVLVLCTRLNAAQLRTGATEEYLAPVRGLHIGPNLLYIPPPFSEIVIFPSPLIYLL